MARDDEVGGDVDRGVLLTAVTNCGDCGALACPSEESSWSIVIEADDSVCEDDGAFEEERNYENDEESKWHMNARSLLGLGIMLSHVFAWRVRWRRRWCRRSNTE